MEMNANSVLNLDNLTEDEIREGPFYKTDHEYPEYNKEEKEELKLILEEFGF